MNKTLLYKTNYVIPTKKNIEFERIFTFFPFYAAMKKMCKQKVCMKTPHLNLQMKNAPQNILCGSVIFFLYYFIIIIFF